MYGKAKGAMMKGGMKKGYGNAEAKDSKRNKMMELGIVAPAKKPVPPKKKVVKKK